MIWHNDTSNVVRRRPRFYVEHREVTLEKGDKGMNPMKTEWRYIHRDERVRATRACYKDGRPKVKGWTVRPKQLGYDTIIISDN
jgi:hypothetical protein